jgi:glycosyltransferase involved in cell wall biosynthesis
MVSWDILITTIEARAAMLNVQLALLAPQIVPGVRVLIHRSNLDVDIGEARQILLETSTAEYVSFIDDDDQVAPDYVSEIVKALESKPDMVGFLAHYTIDGVEFPQLSFSVRHGGWGGTPTMIYRDFFALAPIRRELTLLAGFEGWDAEDLRWADRLRALHVVHSEVFVDRELYRLNELTAVRAARPFRVPVTNRPPKPEWPFVTWL